LEYAVVIRCRSENGDYRRAGGFLNIAPRPDKKIATLKVAEA